MKDEMILELINVTKVYKERSGKKFQAVKNINMHILKGEWIGIVGESGSGKSTIAKMISHLTSVTSGTMMFQGQDSTSLKKKELKEYYKQVQMIFQDPLLTFSPRMKIGHYLIEPFINFKLADKKEAFKMAEELLELVGLNKEFMERYPHELSGGQLQRVVIARVIGLNPSLIICDECTSALDATTQKQILQLLIDLRKRINFSCMFITHDLSVAKAICDRIYIMRQGEIVEEVYSTNLLKDAKHLYTTELLQAATALQPLRPSI